MAKSKVKEPDDVKVEAFTTALKVQLSEEEIAARANEAAHVLQQRDDKDADMKAAAKHAKSIIDELEQKLRKLSNEVRSGETYTAVNCERRYNYTAGQYTEVRLDTDEVLHERRLTDSEKQKELPFDERN